MYPLDNEHFAGTLLGQWTLCWYITGTMNTLLVHYWDTFSFNRQFHGAQLRSSFTLVVGNFFLYKRLNFIVKIEGTSYFKWNQTKRKK